MDEIEIVGVRTPLRDSKAALAELHTFARSKGGWAQILDAGRVVGADHVISAFEHAQRAIERGSQKTNSLEVELLLYASGEHQISRAIERVGARAGKPFVLVLGGGVHPEEVLGKFRWTRDDGVVRPSLRKLRALGFARGEIESAGGHATDLVLELVARVDLLK
ncbi:MAG TPA: KEOPS complex subunit Cgi121 [Thermoplasmata archaeon]